MLKKKIIPVFLASVLTVSGTTGFVTEAFSENVYAAEEVHTERLADFADLLDCLLYTSSDLWMKMPLIRQSAH